MRVALVTMPRAWAAKMPSLTAGVEPRSSALTISTRAAWTPQGNQSLTVEHEGAVIGGGGVFRRTPNADWEIGYWIGRPWWGQGFATEIGQALVELGTQTLGASRLIAGHYDDNPASGRVLEKLGFGYTGKAEHLFAMARMARVTSLNMVREAAV